MPRTSAEQALAYKRWYAKDPERARAIGRKWYYANRHKAVEYRNSHREEKNARERGYYAANNEIRRAQQRAKYQLIKDMRKAKAREKYTKVREQLNTRTREWYAKNKEQRKAKARANYAQNVEKRRASMRERQRKRLRSDLAYKIVTRCRTRMYLVIRRSGNMKPTSVSKLLGCERDFLIGWLEAGFKPGMTWANYGRHGWHVDHIQPCDSFDLSNPAQLRRCFHFTNLQPLWAAENMSKGNKLVA